MSASLVGSEMCIRDRGQTVLSRVWSPPHVGDPQLQGPSSRGDPRRGAAVSYTHLTLPTICSV
eukprot:9338353-Alexandrium_andersonii.AAC.1